jgi:hypothetical protein
LPYTKPSSTASNLAEGEGEEDNEAVDDHKELTAEPGDGNITRQRSAMKASGKPKQTSFENQMLEISSAKQQAGTEENVTIATSLVPFLMYVSEDKKIDARIEILQDLWRFTNTQPVQLQSISSTVLQDQHQIPYQIAVDPHRFPVGMYRPVTSEMHPVPSTSCG